MIADRGVAIAVHPIDREMRDWQARAFRLAGATQLEILLEHGQPDGPA